ncbi:DNA-binding GntR family transcriptional regulator [Angulomicrobium tetraedrale]|uniref:DNA-binding GntR family transcriptional regulator n=1 Tax=Ancylobacter tetraedralis TaxID=217068 RepID=A0A839ZAT8_9HYPH|nr:GntR family transcriptional regulator [Ancylobacter tetraedralis]MBB3771822.1 DNA-binding GntR family transcriptional regulator [Ancylobacter tetraedralis]
MDNHLHQTNLRDQALAVLKLRLVSGDLAPGQIYSASSLAAELGVSNSPVREAMLTLVNQGLMEAVRNRGFRVIPLSDKDRRNVYDLRILLEIPSMARLASMKEKVIPRKNEFSKIAAEIVEGAKSGDIVRYLDADRSFHLGLLGILDNEQLTTIVENLRDQTRQYGLQALARDCGLINSAEEHQPILDAIISGDQPRVIKLMTDHLSHLVGDWAG